jgi:phage repressor protein C with HTH and peptisase S24 domain
MKTAYALAKAAGINHSTITKQLRGSEPGRPYLNAIAKAAGVNVGWLSDGQGLRDPVAEPAMNSFDWETSTAIRHRFAQIGKTEGADLEALSKATGIQIDRLQQVLGGSVDASTTEALRICRFTNTSLLWLLLGYGMMGHRMPGLSERYFRAFLSQPNKLDEATKLHVAVADLLAPLNEMDFFILPVTSDAMSPAFERGDILIADKGAASERDLRGTFVVSDNEDVFACNLTPDRNRVTITFNKPGLQSLQRDCDADPEKRAQNDEFLVIGRVIQRLALRPV